MRMSENRRATARRTNSHDTKGVIREIGELHRKSGIYTKPAVVATVLTAIGWIAHADLSKLRLLEPAAGDGAFVAEAARRLVKSLRNRRKPLSAELMAPRIRAYELHTPEAEKARRSVRSVLKAMGVSPTTAACCARTWILTEDFLLRNLAGGSFSHATGNPPYIRWGKIPPKLRARYERVLSPEMTGGDLFLPFVDRTLESLKVGGKCGLVCSDRWRYMAFGEAFRQKWLRQLTIRSNDSIKSRDAFERNVSSYASVFIVTKKARSADVRAKQRGRKRTIEELGCTVKVGPALGCTPAFVVEADERDVEPFLLRAWLDGSEIIEGEIARRSRSVIEMHRDKGSLLQIESFPRLQSRLERFRKRLSARSIVDAGSVWYSTIDKVCAADWSRPKLLVPELSRVPRCAIDRHGRIPSHGVYAIFAPDDDVDALYARLKEGRLAKALEGLAPKVNGGYVRCYKRFLLKVEI